MCYNGSEKTYSIREMLLNVHNVINRISTRWYFLCETFVHNPNSVPRLLRSLAGQDITGGDNIFHVVTKGKKIT